MFEDPKEPRTYLCMKKLKFGFPKNLAGCQISIVAMHPALIIKLFSSSWHLSILCLTTSLLGYVGRKVGHLTLITCPIHGKLTARHTHVQKLEHCQSNPLVNPHTLGTKVVLTDWHTQ